MIGHEKRAQAFDVVTACDLATGNGEGLVMLTRFHVYQNFCFITRSLTMVASLAVNEPWSM